MLTRYRIRTHTRTHARTHARAHTHTAGTTGETLECLTKALSGMEHKLNICFNKCDQFSKMHDFARAFGALCWNLSKV